MSDKYPTDARKLRSSEHLCNEDLIGEEFTWTMKEAAEGEGPVAVEMIPEPPHYINKAPANCLHFKETTKRLVLGAGRTKVLQLLYGNKLKDWVGKRITLYRDPNVRVKGKKTGGIKLKPPTEGTSK